MKTESSSHTRRIQLKSQSFYFDMLSFKKYQQTFIKIPETIILEKGYIKEWIFNSIKQNGRILKKKKENCQPINVVKHLCLKEGFNVGQTQIISNIKTQIAQIIKEHNLKQSNQKTIEVVTSDNEIFSMTLNQFLNYISENRFGDHQFFDKWKMIRQRVSFARIDQYYEVQNVRRNHKVQSKCQKKISLNTLEITQISTQMQQDQFKNVSPSKQLPASETKNIQGYKFFDTFLNKKFFEQSHELIQFIEKNYKCIVEQVKTKFVINKNRQPYLIGIQNMVIKPVKKLFQSKQFQFYFNRGSIMVDQYMKLLVPYLQELQKSNKKPSLNVPISQQKKFKCHGNFCLLHIKSIPHLLDPSQQQKTFLLQKKSSGSIRKINSDFVIAIQRRRKRVLQRMKEHRIIDKDYEDIDQDSSQYEQSQDQTAKNVKVCENCFIFYLHSLRLFDIDAFGGLIQKKVALPPSRKVSEKKLPPLQNQSNILQKLQDTPQKHANITDKLMSKTSSKKTLQKLNYQPRSNSSQKDRKTQSLSKKLNYGQNQNDSPIKKISFTDRKQIATKQSQNKWKNQTSSTSKLIPLKKSDLKNETVPAKGNRLLALSKSSQPIDLKQISKSKTQQHNMFPKNNRPLNYLQAQQILVKKLSILPSSNRQEFIYFARKYYKDNLPQPLDRHCYSSQYIQHLYEFMNITPIFLAKKYQIKKKPEMTLKRLSELTDYPEIVSKSSFLFDTLIADEKTTIPFCVITTRMINGRNSVGVKYQNIFIINDMFDSFIQYISLAKDLLEQASNKRIILFNYPGQSHTIYNQDEEFNICVFSSILDKLVFRLSQQKQQLRIIDFQKDNFKFIGFGYGGQLISSWIAQNNFLFQQRLRGVFLINTYKFLTDSWKQKLQGLLQLYKSDDPTAQSEAFLYYNKAILSAEISSEDLQHKAGLNSIRLSGRCYLLNSILGQSFKQQNIIIQQFQNITVPVTLLYGRSNVIFSKSQAQSFLIAQDTKPKKQQIKNRKFLQIQGGHDILADNYQGTLKFLQQFLKI